MENLETLKQNHNDPLRYLVFAASLRKDSLNEKLAKIAAHTIEKKGGSVDFADMSEFDCPSYNQDMENEGDIPAGAVELRKRLLANNAFIISSPEYNGSMPGFMKNAIDWVSRFRPQPFNEKNAMLMSASPSMAGGNKALWSFRIPLEHLGTRVYPNMFSLAIAHKAFTSDGKIADDTLAERFDINITAFMNTVEASIHYPCMKRTWVEFLGEKTDQYTERVE